MSKTLNRYLHISLDAGFTCERRSWMVDRDKVIKGLEACVDGECEECRYREECNDAEDFVELARDALELLKAQEAVPPGKTEIWEGITYAICGYCGNAVMRQYSYCPFCGRKVAWE